MASEKKKAALALADGTFFEGLSFGAMGERAGEVVFNTNMTGYQEVLTDPSYKGQLVCMTYPLIGNYGINQDDIESPKPKVDGFIVKECCPYPSNWRNSISLDDYLKGHGIIGIQGIDTRALTRHIRDFGAQQGIISAEDLDRASLVRKARDAPSLIGRDLVKEVTCHDRYIWRQGEWSLGSGYKDESWAASEVEEPQKQARPYHVVVYDFGVKFNILRNLVKAGCKVTVVPAATPPAEVLALGPDGILFSNGPGDPEGVPYAIEAAKKLIGEKPIFGICLGHQIIGLALGCKTFKLKFGHRGGNQPVMDLMSGRVEITSQNHGFAVEISTMTDELELTHLNLNDRTAEGMRHKVLPLFSVQYHPEASPGPHDSRYLFDQFIAYMAEAR